MHPGSGVRLPTTVEFDAAVRRLVAWCVLSLESGIGAVARDAHSGTSRNANTLPVRVLTKI